MAGSIERVEQAARDAGLDDRGEAHGRLDAHGRGSRRAMRLRGRRRSSSRWCSRAKRSGRLYLFLVSGAHQLDPDKAAALDRREAGARRSAPRSATRPALRSAAFRRIGHQVAIAAFADEALLAYDRVWAAAGAHDAVFAAEPAALFKAAGATVGRSGAVAQLVRTFVIDGNLTPFVMLGRSRSEATSRRPYRMTKSWKFVASRRRSRL